MNNTIKFRDILHTVVKESPLISSEPLESEADSPAPLLAQGPCGTETFAAALGVGVGFQGPITEAPAASLAVGPGGTELPETLGTKLAAAI
ncbi:hypothetical protein COLO4_22710 [Corchorus olitorius]|uniref:Uncharacterized protein n=1 Tax=Corchorus olitorius TaxID=93759 RepID=A0A1R3IKM4_9ROSI|nr:hypothetical protein COLO4_22710 [Corchorus olitorius]